MAEIHIEQHIQDLISFFETKDQEMDRKIRAEKFIKKMQLKPSVSKLKNSAVHVGPKGVEFLEEAEQFVPPDLLDLVKKEITIKKPKLVTTFQNSLRDLLKKGSPVKSENAE